MNETNRAELETTEHRHTAGNVEAVLGYSLREDPSSGCLYGSVILAALAGCMGWGIRGQYGHETGAMIAGVLVGFVLVLIYCPQASSLRAARAVALCAIGFSFGGSMTYGQTVGLTHDGELVGNWAALRWGMLGLFIKGGVWIGFGGALFGIGLSGKRYRPLEMFTLFATLLGCYFLGVYLLNEPYRPNERVLPALYFSDHWHWEPDKADLKPRRETWGGLALALGVLFVYLGWIKKDRLARNMTIVGVLSGGFGFTVGQAIQCLHGWKAPFLSPWVIGVVANWWNMMEKSFGFVLGFGMGLGVWTNRHLIAKNNTDGDVEIPIAAECLLAVVYVGALFGMHLQFSNPVLAVGAVPIIAIAGGRYWPYIFPLPLLALPIAIKTLRARGGLGSEPSAPTLEIVGCWVFYLVLPLAVCLAAAIYFARRGRSGETGRLFLCWGLVLAAWTYFWLNFAFFNYPWWWTEWGSRSFANWVFTISTLALTFAAIAFHRRHATSSIASSGDSM